MLPDVKILNKLGKLFVYVCLYHAANIKSLVTAILTK